VVHHPAPNLDELQLKATQRPVLDCLGQAQAAQEVSQVITNVPVWLLTATVAESLRI
jgi:hypothetical protein